ncbi:hypothetical protein U14_03130 [Candidatus Moduliflexus flocculans]|uniref:Uncharacterized protein n=1 Tax=Candidatus Moduliflexus flocculans TaxID=1499966 RepID=A0A081BNB8_9BACT|nr:hypothetical protein U14_03130 [Candidatus Moduliflexus flocculans]
MNFVNRDFQDYLTNLTLTENSNELENGTNS